MRLKGKIVVCDKNLKQVSTLTHCNICEKADNCIAVKRYLIIEDGEIS